MSFEIYPNKKMFPLYLAICIIICGLSYLGFTKIEVSNSIDQTYIRYIMVSLFILGAYYGVPALIAYLRILFSSKAKITINEEGIIDNLTSYSCGKINWSDVTDIKIQNAYNIKFLIIEVANPDSLLSQQTKRKQRMLKSVVKKFGSPAVIPQTKVNCSLESMELQMKKYMALAY